MFRTAAQRAIFEDAQDITDPMLVEVYQAAAVVIYGKLKRLNDLYYLRNLGVPCACPAGRRLVPMDGEILTISSRAIVDIATRSWRSSPRAASMVPTSASVKRIVDMSFILYVGRDFHMGYWIDEFLATAVTDPKERNRLREQLTASLSTPQGATATLGGALKASLKSTVKQALR